MALHAISNALFAGPVNIHERVRNAMIVPGENHRDPWFAPFYKGVLEQMKYLFQTTEGTPIIFPGVFRTECSIHARQPPYACMLEHVLVAG